MSPKNALLVCLVLVAGVAIGVMSANKIALQDQGAAAGLAIINNVNVPSLLNPGIDPKTAAAVSISSIKWTPDGKCTIYYSDGSSSDGNFKENNFTNDDFTKASATEKEAMCLSKVSAGVINSGISLKANLSANQAMIGGPTSCNPPAVYKECLVGGWGCYDKGDCGKPTSGGDTTSPAISSIFSMKTTPATTSSSASSDLAVVADDSGSGIQSVSFYDGGIKLGDATPFRVDLDPRVAAFVCIPGKVTGQPYWVDGCTWYGTMGTPNVGSKECTDTSETACKTVNGNMTKIVTTTQSCGGCGPARTKGANVVRPVIGQNIETFHLDFGTLAPGVAHSITAKITDWAGNTSITAPLMIGTGGLLQQSQETLQLLR